MAQAPAGRGLRRRRRPLTPVMALPTADGEVQMGLARVDLDAFLSYASIIPEFCRLETMLIKGIV